MRRSNAWPHPCGNCAMPRTNSVRKERLATLGQLAGGVAHELRTPLSVMRNSVYYPGARPAQSDPTIRDLLGEMQRAVVSSDHITRGNARLRPGTVPRDQSLSDRPSDRPDALRLVALPRYRAAHQGRLVIRRPRCRPIRDQATRILVNLIQNAIPAMAYTRELGSRWATRSRAKAKSAFPVRDTGCGIPPENLDKIFDALFTTRDEKGSRGLGLAISLRYASALNRGSLHRRKRGRGRHDLPAHAGGGQT